MSCVKLITRFTIGGHDIFITSPAKSTRLEPVHAFFGTGDENIISTCRSAGNYHFIFSSWFRILIGLEHVTCRATFCNVSNVSLWRHLPRAALAERSDIIKRNKGHGLIHLSIESGYSKTYERDSESTLTNLIFSAGWSKISLPARTRFCFVL